ncbi:MAG: DNA repair protein RecN [Gammaproteobacteria bacterium]|nr:DNA repair protein RecN [Gammaproteobacteria bacterium]
MATAVLRSLTIRDFALVASLDIAFADGLTVITGESGAGKSILLGALGLVLGERAAADTVRHGADRADITAEFDLGSHPGARQLLEEQALTDPDSPDRCLVRRVVGADGRSRAFINGAPVTLQVLRALSEDLIDIHGQHDNQRITEPRVQLALLDDFGVETALRRACRDSFRAWKRARDEAAELEGRLQQHEDRATLLTYQLEELDGLGLAPGELEAIESEHRRLSQVQDLRASVSQSLEALDEDAVAGRVLRLLDNLDDDHPRLAAARDAVRSADDLLRDAVRDLRSYDASLELDPERLQALDDRLAAIHDLARKHRVAPEQLAAHGEALAAELQGISTDRSSLDDLRAAAGEHRAEFEKQAARVSKQRRSAARDFARAVSGCMETLGIKGGSLTVEFFAAESETGLEGAEFHVTTNPKYPPGTLQRIASGGERARIALAIQVVAAEKSAMPCLVLDEADVGVGGTTADVVGRLLRSLAVNTQVICVTHAPQVAALGHNHLRVSKDAEQDTRIEGLATDTRVEELARMLAGADITDKSRDYARTLLSEAGN